MDSGLTVSFCAKEEWKLTHNIHGRQSDLAQMLLVQGDGARMPLMIEKGCGNSVYADACAGVEKRYSAVGKRNLQAAIIPAWRGESILGISILFQTDPRAFGHGWVQAQSHLDATGLGLQPVRGNRPRLERAWFHGQGVRNRRDMCNAHGRRPIIQTRTGHESNNEKQGKKGDPKHQRDRVKGVKWKSHGFECVAKFCCISYIDKRESRDDQETKDRRATKEKSGKKGGFEERGFEQAGFKEGGF